MLSVTNAVRLPQAMPTPRYLSYRSLTQIISLPFGVIIYIFIKQNVCVAANVSVLLLVRSQHVLYSLQNYTDKLVLIGFNNPVGI